MPKPIKVTSESSTGLNQKFQLPSGEEIPRGKLANQINQGLHPGYHVRKINGKNIPCSNPDTSKKNNLG